MIDYVWKRGKWVAIDAGDNLDLVITSSQGERISLEPLHVDEVSKMLGIYVAPDGNKKAIITDLKTASINLGSRVKIVIPLCEKFGLY